MQSSVNRPDSPPAAPPAGASRVQVPDTVAVKKHYGRWLTVAVLAAIAFGVVKSLAQNPQLEWDVVGQYLSDCLIL